MNGYDFKFLKLSVKKHPNNGMNLEFVDKHNDAVCVIVFDDTKENVYLVKQFRPGSNCYLLEAVAGLIDEGEEPIAAAYRETEEELGISKDQISKFVAMPNYQYVTPGYSTEKLYFYAAILKKDAVFSKQNLDEGEEIEIVQMNTEEALLNLNDLKSMFAIKYFKDME